MWDLIVSVPDHCLSFYFPPNAANRVSILEGSHIRYDNVTVSDI